MIRTNAYIFGGLLSVFLVMGAPNETTYDQRQSGDYNIHISLKDIRIVALLNGGLGGSEDYDYNYDYNEMTIKPSIINQTINTTSTTPKTQTTTKKDDPTTTQKVVEITPPPYVFTQRPVAHNVTKNSTVHERPKPVKRPEVPQNIPVSIVLTPINVTSNNVTYPNKNTHQPASATVSNATRLQADCIEGFAKDREGNCRPRIKKLPQQTLLRKLIQLSHRAHHSKH